jgi:hypothetical protein
MLIPAIVVLLVLVAIAMQPKKTPTSEPKQSLASNYFQPAPSPAPIQQMSFREQMLSEEAAEVSAAFRDAANKKWREEVIAKASTLLSAS